jgi:hypothetical protein
VARPGGRSVPAIGRAGHPCAGPCHRSCRSPEHFGPRKVSDGRPVRVRASRRLAGVLYPTSYHCPRNGAVRFQNTRKATTMPTRTRVKEMPSTQRTTPGVSPCRAFVVASLGGGWSDITNPRTHRPVTRCWADLWRNGSR